MKFIKNHATLIGALVFLFAGTLAINKLTNLHILLSFASTLFGLFMLACSESVYNVFTGVERKREIIPFLLAGGYITFLTALGHLSKVPSDDELQFNGMTVLPVACYLCAIIWPFNVAMYKRFKRKYPHLSMFGPFGG